MKYQGALKTVIVGSILIVLLFFGFRIATASVITVVVGSDLPANQVSIVVDGKRVFPSGFGNQRYTAQVGAGKHQVSVKVPGYKDFSTTVTTSLRSEKRVTATLEETAAATVAEEVSSETNGADDDIDLVNARYFGKKDWLVYFAGDGSGDGSIVVARFDAQKNTWTVVAEGTDIDTGTEAFKQAPGDLLTYLRGY